MYYRQLLLALLLALPAPLLAQQDNPPPANPPAAAPSPSPSPSPMQQHMQDMHAQMERIIETEDPAERRRLWQEHRQQMEEHMATMMREGGHEKHGGPGGMHGGGPGGGMHGGGPGGMHGGDRQTQWNKLAFEEMSKRLDLLQTLIESHLLDEE